MHRLLGRVALLAVVLSLAAVRGAAAEPGAKEKARIHFKAGSSFLEIGEYDKAIAEYLEAYRILPLPDFLFNIGQAYRLKGTPGDRQHAAQYYRKYLHQRPDGVGVAEARQHLAIIEKEPGLIINDAPPSAPATETPKPPPAPAPATTTTTTVESPPAAAPAVTAPAIPPPRRSKVPLIAGVVAAVVVVAGVAVGVGVGVAVGGAPHDPTPTGGVINFSLAAF